MRWSGASAARRRMFIGGVLVGAAALVAGGVLVFAPHRPSTREVELGAVDTPVTTDPTATDDPTVRAVVLGSVYPTVASIATTSADGSGYTVRLRADAPVDARQVADALSRSHGSGSAEVRAALSAVDEVSTVDDRTLHIGLSRPDADLPGALAGPAGAVVVPGAGPYRIAGFAPGRSLTLTRQRGPGPARVHWHFYGDAQSLRAELAAGRLDLVAPAVDGKLPGGARRVDGPAGPVISVAVNPGRRSDQKLLDAVRSAASAAPAVVAVPSRSGQVPLIIRATNEPDVVAAAETVRRALAVSGVPATVSAAPPERWRQLVDAGSYDVAVGTGLSGDAVGAVGTVRYAMIVTGRIAGVPRLGAGGAVDLSTVRPR